MKTDHHRPYELEPIVIGRGLDEFAREDELPPSTFEIEDVTQAPLAGVATFEWEEAPVPVVAAPVAPLAPRLVPVRSWVARGRATATHGRHTSAAAVRGAVRRGRRAISTAFLMMARGAGVVGAWMVVRVSIVIVFVLQVIASGGARRRMAWKSLGAQWVGASALLHRRVASGTATATHGCRTYAAAVRGAVRRGRLAISTAFLMMARGAGVVGAWELLGAQRVGASALLHRRGTVAGLTVASLAGLLAVPSNPPAVSPVAAVSTSTGTPAPQTAADVAGSMQIDLRAAALQPEPFAAASLERPVVPATLTAAAQSAGPELQRTVYGGTTLDFQSDTPRRPPVLPAVADHDPPSTTAAEPIPVPVAIVSAALEAPKPAAAEPAAYMPSAVGTAPDTVAADRSAIDDVLVAYRRSYNALDAGAVSAIWRGADTRALARAFSSLTRQHMTFDRCDVRVTDANRARARCDGILSYVQKAGDTTPHQRRVSWSMDLGRPDDRWVIVGLQAR